jgi:hypothetical protein
VATDHGTVWAIPERGDTLRVDADEGLLRLTPPAKSDTPEPPVEIPANPPFTIIAPK